MFNNVDPYNAMTGYESKTTFWADFSIAEKFGKEAIRKTFDNSIKSFGSNIEYMTELALTTNHKLGVLFETNKEFASLYETLWIEIDNYILDHFKNDKNAIQYYLETTD